MQKNLSDVVTYTIQILHSRCSFIETCAELLLDNQITNDTCLNYCRIKDGRFWRYTVKKETFLFCFISSHLCSTLPTFNPFFHSLASFFSFSLFTFFCVIPLSHRCLIFPSRNMNYNIIILIQFGKSSVTIKASYGSSRNHNLQHNSQMASDCF